MTKSVFPTTPNLALITFYYLITSPGDTELLNYATPKSLSLCVSFKPDCATFTLKLSVQNVSCI